MSKLERVEAHFTGGAETQELEDYRPISPLVIGACAAGLASLLAVMHPILWCIPVVAVALSCAAIAKVSAPHSRYGGRIAAVLALCVAVFVGTYAPVRTLARGHALYSRAEEKARAWISLIQEGRIYEAHQLTLGPDERFRGPGLLVDHYVSERPKSRTDADSSDPGAMIIEESESMMPSASEQLAGFLQSPVTIKVKQFGEQGTVERLKNTSISSVYGNTQIMQTYRVSGMHDGDPGSIEFVIQATRWEDPDTAEWQIADFREVH